MNATVYAAKEVLAKSGTELHVYMWADFNPRRELITTVNDRPFQSLEFRHTYKANDLGAKVNVYAITGWNRI
jgi:hypothetical protein